MLFVSIGDNTIVNLKFIQSIDFNDERTEVKVYWFSGHTRAHSRQPSEGANNEGVEFNAL